MFLPLETNVRLTNPPTNFTTQELSKDIIGEQAVTPKGAVEDDPMKEHQVVSTIISDQTSNEEYMLSVLNDLPEQ